MEDWKYIKIIWKLSKLLKITEADQWGEIFKVKF